jgi:hypothetical protein
VAGAPVTPAQLVEFEPLRIDPTPQLDAGAIALGLDRTQAWQVNVCTSAG